MNIKTIILLQQTSQTSTRPSGLAKCYHWFELFSFGQRIKSNSYQKYKYQT